MRDIEGVLHRNVHGKWKQFPYYWKPDQWAKNACETELGVKLKK